MSELTDLMFITEKSARYASQIAKESELRSRGISQTTLIPRISVFKSRKDAETMRFYTKDQIDNMGKKEKEEYENKKAKQEEIIQGMWLEEQVKKMEIT